MSQHKNVVKVLGLLVMLTVSWATAATWTVTNTNDTGLGSLREAIDSANSGDIITFDVSGTINLNSELTVSQDDLTIDASGKDVTVSGQNNHRVFNRTSFSGTFTINNLVVTGGRGVDFDRGGGIHSNGNVTVTNSTISGNSVNTDGGGIYGRRNVTVTNSIISGNSADAGGGIVGSNVTVTNSTISGNSARFGGGIFNDDLFDEAIILNNSLVLGNTASSSDPQIFVAYPNFDNVVLNNSAYGFAAGESTGNSFVDSVLTDVFTNLCGVNYALKAGSPAINAGNNSHPDC